LPTHCSVTSSPGSRGSRSATVCGRLLEPLGWRGRPGGRPNWPRVYFVELFGRGRASELALGGRAASPDYRHRRRPRPLGRVPQRP
jgi:hypothetical protein